MDGAVVVQILTDADVARSCTASRAVRVMRQAIAAHADGRLAAPPRAYTQLEAGPMVYTAGALRRRVHGVRIYDYAGSEQAVAVWNSETGRLVALAVGDELGRRRTGAIGAVAIDALARPDASTLGIVGTGDQAWAQVWAATAVRHWRRVTVYGRRFSAREAFAARCRDDLLVEAVAVESAERAVRGRDVVVIATNSSTPVIDMSWISPGTHVTTLGPKTVTAHEMPLDLADQADVLVTDSLSQIRAYPEPYALPTDRMLELSAVLSGTAPGRRSRDQITVFCSVGLAGTEVVLAADLAGIGTEEPKPQVRTQRHRAAPADELVDELGPEAAAIAAGGALGEPIGPAQANGAPAPEPAAEPAESTATSAGGAEDAETEPDTPGRTVSPDVAAELQAAVAEMATIPPPRIPAGDGATEFGGETADEAATSTPGGKLGKLPTRPVPGVRSAKDILAAAKEKADVEAESEIDVPDDSMKTLDEIFAFSDLTTDRPPAVSGKISEASPAETSDTASDADSDTTAKDPSGGDSPVTSAAAGDGEPSTGPAAGDQPAAPAQADGKQTAPAEKPAAQPGGKAAGSSAPKADGGKPTPEPGKDAGTNSPATPAKVVSRRDAPARVGGAQGRGGQQSRSGQRGGDRGSGGGGPHRDRPTGGTDT
jgi:ornithine cyclodeaminase/alanine dehydrogenase-like protein (mu-crystallin family)